MAVVQISKIQVRRGRKNSGIGVPQLSSGELAWAIDSQELFIGNGSIQEGAPYVGNTKVITENDNILELAASYEFAKSDNSITTAVARSLQSKLDEYVSVADFGAINDGSTDCVEAFENAFTQLFRNANTDYRKTLVIPNGDYLFLSNLTIPSNAIIRGETDSGVNLNFGGNSILFVNSDGEGIASFTSSNRPTNINISNLTIAFNGGQFVLSGVGDSQFNDITFESNYTMGGAISGASISDRSGMISWENDTIGIRVTGIDFNGCTFKDTQLGIKCVQTAVFETEVNFEKCNFFNSYDAVYIEGVSNQVNSWTFVNCKFEEIYSQAFLSTAGKNTRFDECEFFNVGNAGLTSSNARYRMVEFGESASNILTNCKSNRIKDASLSTDALTPYINDVEGAGFASFLDVVETPVYTSDAFAAFAIVSSNNRYTHLDYTLQLGSAVRRGRITVMVNDLKENVAIQDEYDYSVETSSSGAIMTNFEFSAELKDNDTDSGIETVVLKYKNPIVTGSAGTLAYSVSYGV